ncbi:unnamed protein product [Umbelopsis vinacea]
MQPTLVRAARLIQFVGPRKNIWNDSASHAGKHPLEPANLEKHVAKANPRAAPQQQQAAPAPAPSKKPTASSNAIEFSQIPARYKRPLLSEAEMEVIQSNADEYISRSDWYDDIDDVNNINDLIDGKCLVSLLLYKNKLNIRTLQKYENPSAGGHISILIQEAECSRHNGAACLVSANSKRMQPLAVLRSDGIDLEFIFDKMSHPARKLREPASFQNWLEVSGHRTTIGGFDHGVADVFVAVAGHDDDPHSSSPN